MLEGEWVYSWWELRPIRTYALSYKRQKTAVSDAEVASSSANT